MKFSRKHPDREGFITEEDLRQWLLSSSPEDYNRLFLLVGETGSGKSELCQWLDYNTIDQIHVPIHISRSDTKMQDIARILNHHLPVSSSKFGPPMEIFNVAANDIGRRIIADLILYLPLERNLKEKDKNQLRSLFNRGYFKDKLVRNVANYQQTVQQRGKETKIVIFPRKDFDWITDRKGFPDADAAYSYVNRTITRTLKDLLNIEDVARKLQNISEQYLLQGKRPVLLLEDLTSFTFLAEDLIDYIFDLPKGHYDVVIGWTTGFELAHRDYIFKSSDALTYMKERLEARLVLTDRNRETYFLREHYEDLAKKYLLAIKCGKCKICENDRYGLYPFNSSCLKKIYENLVQEGEPKQTPRMLLEFVIKGVLLHPDFPWRTLERTPFIRPILSKISQTFSKFPDFEMLLKWYGEETQHTMRISHEVWNWFKSEIPPSIQKIDGFLEVPKSEIAKLIRTAAPDESEDETQERIVEFQEWIKNGSLFPSREILRKGVIEIVDAIGTPCEIKNTRSTIAGIDSIWWIRGSDRVPVFIEDSGDDSSFSDFKIHVSRHSPPEILTPLFLLGMGRSIEEVNPPMAIRLVEWAENKATRYNNYLREELRKVLGIPVEQFILFSKFLLLNAVLGSTDVNSIDFAIDLTEIEDDSAASIFPDEYVRNKFQDVFNQKKEIDQLFRSLFFITETFIDRLFLDETALNVLPSITIKKVTSIDLRKIKRSYKVGARNRNVLFCDFIKATRDYASALLSSFDGKKISDHSSGIRAIKGLIPDKLTIEKLRTKTNGITEACAFHNIVLKEGWNKSLEIIKNDGIDFTKFRSEIDKVLKEVRECGDVFHFVSILRRIQRLKQQQAYQIILDLGEIVQLLEIKNRKLIESLGDKVHEQDPNVIKVITLYDQISGIVEILQ